MCWSVADFCEYDLDFLSKWCHNVLPDMLYIWERVGQNTDGTQQGNLNHYTRESDYSAHEETIYSGINFIVAQRPTAELELAVFPTRRWLWSWYIDEATFSTRHSGYAGRQFLWASSHDSVESRCKQNNTLNQYMWMK